LCRLPDPFGQLILIFEIKKVLEDGIVIKTTGSWHTVLDSGQKSVPCKIKGKLRTHGIRSTNPVAVGDRVRFHRLEKEATGIITEIHDRKNYIIRKSSKLSKESHVLAANLDQAFLMISLVSPRTTLRFTDRFLATAEAYEIPPFIIFNKTDLYDENLTNEMGMLREMYGSIGYQSVSTSAVLKKGISELKEKMKDKITLLAGNSGVGKSSIINVIDPSLDLKTKPVSELHSTGKHTTTFSEMFELSSGGFIIDTPGIKGFGMIDMDQDEISHFFPEIFAESKYCQYYNCLHINEPNCAVKKALEDKRISLSRYESYLSLFFEDKGKYRTSRY
jgi:ribosome biogenesis GTPase / thiamine phosphate phosphatase